MAGGAIVAWGEGLVSIDAPVLWRGLISVRQANAVSHGGNP